MVRIINNTTREEVIINNCKVIADNLLECRYEVKTRFWRKFGHMCALDRNEGGKSYIKIFDGWSIVRGRTAAQPDSSDSADSASPSPQSQEPAQPKPEQPAQVTPTMDAAVEAFTALTPLFAGVQANVERAIMQKVQPILDRAPQVVTHVVELGDAKKQLPSGTILHPNFDKALARIAEGKWIYLYGPTGSGKNVLAKQLADGLGLKFYYHAHVTDRFELTGFIDAAGNYHETEFYRAYTQGGVCMVDEIDASDENALITLNSAANGYFAFPNGTAQQHKDFHLIVAGNTVGRGASSDYTGRRVLDAASLNRFSPMYHYYCREIDMAAAGNDERLVDLFEALRKIKKETGAQMMLSPRQIKAIYNRGNEAISSVMSDELLSYITEDEFAQIKSKLRDSGLVDKDNSYANALLKECAVPEEY